jgi:hypothetical protein
MSSSEHTRQWLHAPNDPGRDLSQFDLPRRDPASGSHWKTSQWASEQSATLAQRCRDCIRDHPMSAVLGSFAIGFVAGAILARR